MNRRNLLRLSGALALPLGDRPRLVSANTLTAQNDVPPLVASGNGTLFAGQEITILIIEGSMTLPFEEVRAEFEAATGCKVNLAIESVETSLARIQADAASGVNNIDGAVIAAWWLGQLIASNFLLPFDDYYANTSATFPAFDADDELPAIRRIRSYDERRFIVPFSADGHVLYYRRDLLTDPATMDAYRASTGQVLSVPQTWDELFAISRWFNESGRITGITIHNKIGGQVPFHYWSLSAAYVLGPENTKDYWFDSETMEPLLNSPGHVRAAEMMKALIDLGPPEQAGWALGKTWEYFLKGGAVFTFSWADLLPLAIQNDEDTVGSVGTSQLPGTLYYTHPISLTDYPTESPNVVGNTSGGSWAGVILSGTQYPEAVYYWWALLATRQKQQFYAARISDGVNPGRVSQIPIEAASIGTGNLTAYTDQGWDPVDVTQYTAAYFQTFNNPLQLPYLRLPGTDEYRVALDIRLADYFLGEVDSAQQAMDEVVEDMKAITLRLGVDEQREFYRKSMQS